MTILNNCDETIWPAVFGRSDAKPHMAIPKGGGWEQKTGEQVVSELVISSLL
jgi:hypothetical protein